ncbi:MAG: Sensor protein KdpD [Verrucomicrobiae bacterium]|nr:Sensor protein KdpD [Verrucomicrobiae bacterium]
MSERPRPNPDLLLAEIKREEQLAKRGQLKIFFGMCPGVGKTFAMLQAAQARQREGVKVVVGIVETHGRAETQALLAGLPIIDRKSIDYRGVTLEEMDIDAILARRPQLVLVDELAHTNAPTSRHPKRYQDVLELLDAGINVYSTLNVQHLESRNDVVQQITGIAMRETVPDTVLDQADEIELIDLTPEHLRKRLAEGKVYLGDRAATAAENFFQEENLAALREIALRVTAESVDGGLKRGRWQATQRLAVGVGPSPYSAQLIRWTRRVASAMDAPWLAIYVETSTPLGEEDKARLTKNLSLARQLGAEVVSTAGDNIAAAILEVAREQGVTQIVVGKPLGHPAREFLRGGSLATKLIRHGGDIDIHIVRGEKTGLGQRRRVTDWLGSNLLRDCGWGTGAVGAVTLVSWLLQEVTGYWAIALVYLLAVVLLAMVLNRWAVLVVATLSAVLWNFLFIPPVFTFHISHVHDLMMFFMYFVVALSMGHFTNQLRVREAAERRRERRTAALNRLLESVTASTSLADGLGRAVKEVDALFVAHTTILLDGAPHATSTFQPDEKELAVAMWALQNEQIAGRFTETLPEATAMYLPLRQHGVLGVRFAERTTLTMNERDLLETMAGQIAVMIESYRLMEQAHEARIAEESEKLHRTLLDSVSHELKTPLAVIRAATEGLATQLDDVPLGKTFIDEIHAANRRLERIVTNLLEMTRIESGKTPLNPEWGEVRELLESAVDQLANEISRERIRLQLPDNLPLVRLDFGLIEQALCNLLINAVQHSPAGTPVEMAARLDAGRLELEIRDHGTGLTPGEEKKIFEKFYRGANSKTGGSGLGLSIVAGIARAHGGEAFAANHPTGGATFTLRLPVETNEKRFDH